MTPYDKIERNKHFGCELHYIMPLILGGDIFDKDNKIWVSRIQHIQLVRYWNVIIKDMSVAGEAPFQKAK